MTPTKRETAAARAGRLLRARREELGLTQADVTAQGGPSAMTLRQIENGSQTDPRPWTIAGLERVLSLPRGTYDELIAGGSLPNAEVGDVTGETLRAQAKNLLARAERLEHGPNVTAVRSMRLPDDLWDQVVLEADEEGRPVSALVRDALRDYLERNR